MTNSGRRRPARTEGTARFEAFTDGVIAIVVTLLAFELRVPHVEAGESLLDALAALTPKFSSFTVSFVTVAIYWGTTTICGWVDASSTMCVSPAAPLRRCAAREGGCG